jgi:iron complex outermembrane recepter protein
MFRSVRIELSLGGSVCAIVAAVGATSAQNAGPPTEPPGAAPSQQTRSEAPPAAVPPGDKPLPQINVRARKRAAAGARQNLTRGTNAPAVAAPTAPPAVQPPPDLGVGNNAGPAVPLLQQTPSLGKTGTKLEDLPTSVQIINRDVVNQQGGVTVLDSIMNASGIVRGAQDTHYDFFLIRGLNAQFYNDGFREGDQLVGLSHSLNGVKQVEILEGPGSALFGSGPPGGTVNIVHYTPSSDFHYGASVQAGSFGTINSTGYVTGPASIPGLNYRIDGTASHTDGFRGLKGSDYEIRPDVVWNVNNHTVEFSLDARQLNNTPDSYGIIYYNGSPLKSVPIDTRYTWPFNHVDQNYIRPTVTDNWFINDVLTINNRLSYLYRDFGTMRTGDSSSTHVDTNPSSKTFDQVVGMQIRNQHDRDSILDYQLEPVWKFATGPVTHTLLTGFEYIHEIIDTQRTTADLPNIPNAFAPVPPMLLPSQLAFQCGKVQSAVTGLTASHSCDDDHLAAEYYSLYATDQVDVTDRLKVRAGVRQDWWNTALTPLIDVPGGTVNNENVPLMAGVTQTRYDAPVSWNVGALYKLFPGISPYVGVARSYLTNFNSENVQQGIGAPESALQYEAGIRFSLLNDKFVLNTAVFDVTRDNVATPFNDTVVFDSQRTRGYEASLDYKVTDQWRLLANFTAQNAVITDNPQGITSVGNHPQGVPAHMANLWTTYRFSIAGVPGFIVGAGLNYRDKNYSDITNVNSIPAFVIGNAMLGYEADNWGATLNVKNFTNQRYYIEANAAGATVGDSLSAFLKVYIKN